MIAALDCKVDSFCRCRNVVHYDYKKKSWINADDSLAIYLLICRGLEFSSFRFCVPVLMSA